MQRFSLLVFVVATFGVLPPIIKSTPAAPPVKPMPSFATWFVFTQDVDPQDLKNEDAWPYLDSTTANILDAIFNLVKMSRGQAIEPITVPGIEPYLCIHVVSKEKYRKEPLGELDKLLAHCNFVPASSYMFYYSGQKNRKQNWDHLFASLYKISVHMKKTMITDLTQHFLESLGLWARLIPYVRNSEQALARNLGFDIVFGAVYGKRSYRDFSMAASFYEGKINLMNLTGDDNRSRLIVTFASLQTEKVHLGSYQYFKMLYAGRLMFYVILRYINKVNFHVENCLSEETQPIDSQDGLYLDYKTLIASNHTYLLKDTVFMTRLHANFGRTRMAVMQGISHTVFITSGYFDLLDTQSERHLEGQLGFKIPKTRSMLGLQKNLMNMYAPNDYMDRVELESKCHQQEGMHAYTNEILVSNREWGKPMPVTWQDCNDNNRSCSANLFDNDKCLSDHSEVLDTNCYLIKIAKLVKLKERLLLQARSNPPMNQELVVQSIDDGPLAHFFREKVFITSKVFSSLNNAPHFFNEITTPGTYTLTPTKRCSIFWYLSRMGLSNYDYQCVPTGNDTYAPTLSYLDMDKPFWSFVANFFDDYADYKQGESKVPLGDTKEVPFFANVEGVCKVEQNMSKPLDRAVVVLKAVKAWSVWAAHASECPIKGQGDESRDLVEQKWALMDQGYRIWGLVLADKIQLVSLLITYEMKKETMKALAKMTGNSSIGEPPLPRVYLKSCFYASYFYQTITERYRHTLFYSRCNSTCQHAYGFIVIANLHGCADCVRACSHSLTHYANGNQCLPCEKLAFKLDGMPKCQERLYLNPTNDWKLILPLILSLLGIIITLFMAVVLIVNASTPVVKASSIPITRIYIFGMGCSCLGLYVYCVTFSDASCALRRILIGFGYVSRYMALTLYIARLRVMASTGQGRSKSNFITRVGSKFFDALGHARALRIVSIIGFTAQAIVTSFLIYTTEYKEVIGVSPSNYHTYYRNCPSAMIVNCLPAAIFLFLALCICLKSKAVSEFLRQDQKVFGTAILVVYLFLLNLIVEFFAQQQSSGGESLFQCFVIVLRLLEVLCSSFIIWRNRFEILMFKKEENTRENVTKLSSGKVNMPYKNAAAVGNLSKMINQHSANTGQSTWNRSGTVRKQSTGSRARWESSAEKPTL